MSIIRMMGPASELQLTYSYESYHSYFSVFKFAKHVNPLVKTWAYGPSEFCGKFYSTKDADEMLAYLNRALADGHDFKPVSKEELQQAKEVSWLA